MHCNHRDALRISQDEAGHKMSKSLGNVIDPIAVTDGAGSGKSSQSVLPVLGADGLRFWVAAYGSGHTNIYLGSALLKDISTAMSDIRRRLRFILGSLHNFKPTKLTSSSLKSLQTVDRFFLYKLRQYIESVSICYNRFDYAGVIEQARRYSDDVLSSLVFLTVKDRLYCDSALSPSRLSAQVTLYLIGLSFVQSLAPIVPFIAEEFVSHLMHQGSELTYGCLELGWPDDDLVNVGQLGHLVGSLSNGGSREKTPKDGVQLPYAELKTTSAGDECAFQQNFASATKDRIDSDMGTVNRLEERQDTLLYRASPAAGETASTVHNFSQSTAQSDNLINDSEWDFDTQHFTPGAVPCLSLNLLLSNEELGAFERTLIPLRRQLLSSPEILRADPALYEADIVVCDDRSSQTADDLAILQQSESSCWSELCHWLRVSRVNLCHRPLDNCTTNSVASEPYNIKLGPSRHTMCQRCRRHCVENEDEDLCLRCKKVVVDFL